MLKITAIGNVTRDNEIREVGGSKVLNFSIARNDRRTKEVTYVECSLWGVLAERLAPFLNKGSKVYVEGELSMREYNGKTSLNCRVRDIELISSKTNIVESQPLETSSFALDIGDEIPF